MKTVGVLGCAVAGGMRESGRSGTILASLRLLSSACPVLACTESLLSIHPMHGVGQGVELCCLSRCAACGGPSVELCHVLADPLDLNLRLWYSGGA